MFTESFVYEANAFSRYCASVVDSVKWVFWGGKAYDCINHCLL